MKRLIFVMLIIIAAIAMVITMLMWMATSPAHAFEVQPFAISWFIGGIVGWFIGLILGFALIKVLWSHGILAGTKLGF